MILVFSFEGDPYNVRNTVRNLTSLLNVTFNWLLWFYALVGYKCSINIILLFNEKCSALNNHLGGGVYRQIYNRKLHCMVPLTRCRKT